MKHQNIFDPTPDEVDDAAFWEAFGEDMADDEPDEDDDSLVVEGQVSG